MQKDSDSCTNKKGAMDKKSEIPVRLYFDVRPGLTWKPLALKKTTEFFYSAVERENLCRSAILMRDVLGQVCRVMPQFKCGTQHVVANIANARFTISRLLEPGRKEASGALALIIYLNSFQNDLKGLLQDNPNLKARLDQSKLEASGEAWTELENNVSSCIASEIANVWTL